MPELPALRGPVEAAYALDRAAAQPDAYHPNDLSRRLKVGAAALRELDRLRTFEVEVRAALQPGRWRGFSGPDGATTDEALGDVAAAVTALDDARGGER